MPLETERLIPSFEAHWDVPESAGLIGHIVGFGVALVSGPKTSRPKSGVPQARLAGPKLTNVTPFPLNSKRQATKLNRNRS